MTYIFPTAIPLVALPIPAGPLAGLLRGARDRLAEVGRERGIEISISTDFAELLTHNLKETEAGTWYSMLPASDPRFRTLTPSNSFWVRGAATDSAIVSVQAAVIHKTGAGGVEGQLSDLTAFYDDPAAMAPAGEWCRCVSPAARATTGRVVFSLSGWTRPDQRGKGLFPLFSRVSRLVSWTRWQPDAFWGVVEPHAVNTWSEANMGPRHLDDAPTIVYHRPVGHHELRFLRFSPAQMLGDLAVQASAMELMAV